MRAEAPCVGLVSSPDPSTWAGNEASLEASVARNGWSRASCELLEEGASGVEASSWDRAGETQLRGESPGLARAPATCATHLCLFHLRSGECQGRRRALQQWGSGELQQDVFTPLHSTRRPDSVKVWPARVPFALPFSPERGIATRETNSHFPLPPQKQLWAAARLPVHQMYLATWNISTLSCITSWVAESDVSRLYIQLNWKDNSNNQRSYKQENSFVWPNISAVLYTNHIYYRLRNRDWKQPGLRGHSEVVK